MLSIALKSLYSLVLVYYFNNIFCYWSIIVIYTVILIAVEKVQIKKNKGLL